MITLLEHRRRVDARKPLYDPITGDPADPGRVFVHTPDPDCPAANVPITMTHDPKWALVQGNVNAFQRLRCVHDFEYWCAKCIVINHKTLGRDVPFILNAPQRRVAKVLEADRLAGRPIRLLLLKARQWGGSTLVQTYMAWIQSCHKRNWNSIIASQVKDTSSTIRGMYTKMLANYPRDLWEGDEPPKLRRFEHADNVREIAGRGCRVTISSIVSQDSVRGADYAMAHLTETAFWRATPSHSPADLIRAVCGSVALVPYSLIVMESTANGVGNYFHNEWIRCRDGHGDKRTVFVPWYEIEMYRLQPPDYEAFAASLSPYEQMLWDECHCDLDQIYWYRCKAREYQSHDKMMAEYPTTDDEAFASTNSNIFSRRAVEALRKGCFEAEKGEISADGRRFVPDEAGRLKLWQRPEAGGRYVAAVDIGGRSEGADFSVVAVLRVDGPKPEVVAQWRGHVDHDILADIAQAIGHFFNKALLVVESNSLECGLGTYILERLDRSYPNLYRRQADGSTKVGFHTNRATKEIAITNLIAAVRDGTYIERDSMACNELLTYEQDSKGAYAAKEGNHDDILMTRAIALYAAPPPLPKVDLSYLNRPFYKL